MRNANSVRHEAGFTLIELLISLAVLSFGLLGLAGLQVHIVKANAFNREMTIATAIGTGLVEETIAQAKSVGWANLGSVLQFTADDAPSNALVFDTRALVNGSTIVSDPYRGRYRWNRTLDTKSNFAIVDVVVRWPNRYDPANAHEFRFRDVVH